jgi:hypothetical protein
VASTLRDIADAVAGALASVTYESAVVQPSVVRLNWPEYDVEALRYPVIVVAPGQMTITRVDRLNHEYVFSIVVWVARHTPTEAAADDMYDLAEEVIDVLRSHTWGEDVPAFPSGVTSPTSIEIDTNPDEALQERNVWRAVVTAQYTAFRAVDT